MCKGRPLQFQAPGTRTHTKGQQPASGFLEQQFTQQLFAAFRPQIKALIQELIADGENQLLIVDYGKAGRMIGTSYEGVRKLVRIGRLTSVRRSGRHRGIAVAELHDYVDRNQVLESEKVGY